VSDCIGYLNYTHNLLNFTLYQPQANVLPTLKTTLKDLVYKYNSVCRHQNKKGIFHPCFYDNIIYKAKKLKSDTSIYKIIEKYFLIRKAKM